MLRCSGSVLLSSLLLALAACSRQESSPLVREEQPLSGLVSRLHVADPKVVEQLLKGWHEVEQGSWRWTERQFSVALKVPTSGQAATLELKFVLPDVLLTRLQSMTLSATVNGAALPATTYDKPGDQVYKQTVPASAMTGDVARVDFLLDKALPPGDRDRRELGVIVSAVGLE